MLKQCENPKCKIQFETEYTQKTYCTVRCRRTAKDIRAVERDGQRSVVSFTSDMHRMANPTVQQLAMQALLYVANADSRPTILSGTIPDWTPPHGVAVFWKDEEHTEKLMIRDEEAPKDDIMNLFKQSGSEAPTITLKNISKI